MLTKALCVKCRNEYDLNPWGEGDDARWTRGFVNCTIKNPMTRPILTTKPPPRGCVFFMEQSINQGIQPEEDAAVPPPVRIVAKK